MVIKNASPFEQAMAFGLAEIGRCYTAKNYCVLEILFDEPNS